MNKNDIIVELKKRNDGAISLCNHNLKAVRTGRASPSFLDPVVVDDVYGDRMHISQLASLTLADSRTINIQVWDREVVKKIEKAISIANLGVTPISDGQTIRVTLPLLTEDRRKELVKIAYKLGEDSKIAIRNVRRDSIDQIKKLEKDSIISKDEQGNLEKEIQKITDEYVKKIEDMVRDKEKAIESA